MCDRGKMYYAFGEITMPDGSKQQKPLKYTDGENVKNMPDRLRMTLKGDNPNMKKVAPIYDNGVTYIPNQDVLYNINNCIAGSLFSGSKMIFPYVPSPMQIAGKNKTRRSRKGTKKSRRTRRTRRRKTAYSSRRVVV